MGFGVEATVDLGFSIEVGALGCDYTHPNAITDTNTIAIIPIIFSFIFATTSLYKFNSYKSFLIRL